MFMKARSFEVRKARERGVTLIEVLIAMVVLAIGLLGFSALQTVSMTSNRSALYRSFATMYAYDILDCMRANRSAARSGSYNIQFGDAPPTSPSTVAGKDIKTWRDTLAANLPSGKGRVAVNNGFATVRIQWTEGTDTTLTPITKTFQTDTSLRP
jgi:type IV pilus assembly protein PilV